VAERVEIISPPTGVEFPDEWYGLTADTHFWFQWRLEAALRQVREVRLPTTERLLALEVGSGTGVLRDQLEAATAWKIDITDLNLKALQDSRPGRGRTLYYDILECREAFREAYDVVILYDVLEHIEHTRPFVDAVLAHLKPGGYLLLNVPALQILRGEYDLAAGHHRRYSRSTLAQEFAGTSLEIRDLRYWGFFLLPVLVLRKAVQRSGAAPEDTIRSGFRAPGPLVHRALRALMRTELALGLSPLGTSLLLAGRKRA
jgi:SAM-dependent methyltransferase